MTAPVRIPKVAGWPFEPLPPLSYDVIMADPPWLFETRSEKGNGKSAHGQYACLPTPAIAALPVGYLARGDCWLWLWATYPMVRDALDVMEAWGFAYVGGGPWVKRGASGRLAMGTGYVLRCAAEMFLLGRMGSPTTASRGIRNVVEAPRRQHSRKPDAAYATAETLFGPGRRADLFARESRPGWEPWGLEATKFDAQPAEVA